MNTIFRSIDMEVTADKEKRTIVGRAATFGVISRPIKDSPTGEPYKEVIAKGAFSRSLQANADVMCFKEHDTKMILGRTSTGTLQVEEREDGLYVSIDVPNTTFGNDLLESVSRRDINGFSFGFKPTKSRRYKLNGESIVERQEVVLVEVSPTAQPSYNGTEMNLRSEGEVWETETPVTKPDMNILNAQKQRHSFNELINSLI